MWLKLGCCSESIRHIGWQLAAALTCGDVMWKFHGLAVSLDCQLQSMARGRKELCMRVDL